MMKIYLMIIIMMMQCIINRIANMTDIDNKWIFSGKQGFLKANPNRKENGMACYSRQHGFGVIWKVAPDTN